MSDTEIIKPLQKDVDPTISFIFEVFAPRVECVTVVHSTEPLEIRTTILLGAPASPLADKVSS